MSISLCFYSVFAPSHIELDKIGQGLYSFYSTENVESDYIIRRVDLGYSYIYECESENATFLRKQFTKIDGESLRIEGREPVRPILKKFNARPIADTNYGIFAYTPRHSKYIYEGGRKINLQIVRNNEYTIIGWPVILGSY